MFLIVLYTKLHSKYEKLKANIKNRHDKVPVRSRNVK